MNLFKKTGHLQGYLQEARKQGRSTGLVPTMGALHAGHLSLINQSKQQNSLTIATIFVNPAQFNDKKDFEKYPVTIEKDIELLVAAGCDALFWPTVEEIYPNGYTAPVHYELGYLETVLEGKYRPGHFQGVCRVMNRLLDIIQPGNLYMGQKDYQQCMIITRLIQLMGLEEKVNIRICPILREKDGLAMSSRNMRLNKEERAKAPALYETLIFLKQNICNGSLQDLKKEATDQLQKKGFKTDYVEIVNAKTLKPINEWDARTNILGLVAAYIDSVRLIDNMMLN